MGLDNMPHDYPCMTARTALFSGEDEVIDCEATMDAGGCPWRKATDGQNRGTPVIGMMGASCWYRGKSATWMLEELSAAGWDDMPGGVDAFYGSDTPDGLRLTVEECAALSEWMKAHIEAYASLHRDEPERIDHYRYAAWWIGWTGEECGGARAWY